MDLTEKILAGAAANPNVGAALVIGLGCETCQSGSVAELVRAMAPHKPVESFSIQEAGGSLRAIAHGAEAGKRLYGKIAAQQREVLPLDELVLARDRGHADDTTGRSADPVADIVAEMMLNLGGTVITPDFADAAGGMASRGSLPFGGRPEGKGRYVMSTPPLESVSVSAMAAGGSQVCLFTTGTGSPLGNAVCPVIKVCGNPETNRRFADNIDFSAESVLAGTESAEALGARLYETLLDVCSGQLTNAEIIGHQEFAIHRIGPTV